MNIVCIGDSLTSGFGVFKEERWTSILSRNTSFNITNKGINGDTTTGMLCRFYEDVLLLKPTHVIIMGGCNDFISNRSVKNTIINMKEMIEDAIKHDIIPISATEIPLMQEMAKRKWSPGPDYNYVIESSILYRKWILDFSEDMCVGCIDFYKLFQETLKEYSQRELYVDGIHPSALGHRFMAEEATKIINRRDE